MGHPVPPPISPDSHGYQFSIIKLWLLGGWVMGWGPIFNVKLHYKMLWIQLENHLEYII